MDKNAKVVSKQPVKTDGFEKPPLFKFSRKQLCIPYGVFLAVFVVFPLLLIVYYAFTNGTGEITLDNFVEFFTGSAAMSNLLLSIVIGFITTALCLLIGYPVAYILSKFKSARSYILVLLFVMPMWINFVLRAMAMRELLSLVGLFGNQNFICTIIGMVYDFLPFMILPLYTTLVKRDRSLEEAAEDLGANAFKRFSLITVPLSMPAIASGATMVFLPSMSCYVISETFGNGKIPLIGKLIEEQFGTAANWNYGSAIAIVMLVIMLISMIVTGGFKRETTRSSAL